MGTLLLLRFAHALLTGLTGRGRAASIRGSAGCSQPATALRPRAVLCMICTLCMLCCAAGMTSSVDDRLYAFEAVGLLLSQVRLFAAAIHLPLHTPVSCTLRGFEAARFSAGVTCRARTQRKS